MNPMTVDTENISFEKAIDLLQKQIEQLKNGNLSLEDSLKTFRDAVELSRICNAKLDSAQEEVKKIVADENGKDYELEDFEA